MIDVDEFKKNLQDLRANLLIDPYNLEEECKRQSVYYDEVGQLLVEIKAEVKRIKDELEYTELSTKAEVRSNPEKFNFTGKLTNDAVTEIVACQENIRKLKKEFIDVSEVSDAFSVLQTALEQRKSMIKAQVDLVVHNYYSSQDLSRERHKLNEGSENDIVDMRNRRIENEAEEVELEE